MNLSSAARRLLDEARRATLATVTADGRPRLVPVCYAIDPGGAALWIPLDEKPKAVSDPRRLARVRDMVRDPRVTVLVDRWSEEWTELAWLRLDGSGALVEAAGVPPGVIEALLERYPQYADHDLPTRPAIRVSIAGAVGWDAAGGREGSEGG